MFEASKHIDLVVKCMKNLNNEEVDMFLKDLLNLNDTELVMMKKINEMSKDKKEDNAEKILYKNALSESIVEMAKEDAKPQLYFYEILANEVKMNPKKYTYKELAEKFGKTVNNIRFVISKYNLTNYVKQILKKEINKEFFNKILINEVKSNPKKYTHKELAKKFGKTKKQIYEYVSKYHLIDYIAKEKENGNIDNEDVRAEILGFLDKK